MENLHLPPWQQLQQCQSLSLIHLPENLYPSGYLCSSTPATHFHHFCDEWDSLYHFAFLNLYAGILQKDVTNSPFGISAVLNINVSSLVFLAVLCNCFSTLYKEGIAFLPSFHEPLYPSVQKVGIVNVVAKSDKYISLSHHPLKPRVKQKQAYLQYHDKSIFMIFSKISKSWQYCWSESSLYIMSTEHFRISSVSPFFDPFNRFSSSKVF